MVLEKLNDGASRRLSVFDEGTRKFIFLLCLPLIDGVFATLLVTGAVETFSSMVSVALTIFAGAGSLAVLYSHSESRREALRIVVTAIPVLIVGAILISLIAPVYEQILYVGRMEYAAGLVLLVVALEMLDIDVGEKIPPKAILITGVVLSIKNPGALALSLEYVAPALLTTCIASLGLLVASIIDIQRLSLTVIRRGAALVLLLIAASMFGVEVPSGLGLAVFGASVAVSLGNLERLNFEMKV